MRLGVSELHCSAMFVKYRGLLNLLAGTCRQDVYTCISVILGVYRSGSYCKIPELHDIVIPIEIVYRIS